MARITREKFKTFGNVFDNFTEKVLAKLISQGHFDGLESPLFIGKESNVFTAPHPDWPRIVKIYRLESCDFNQMYSYIRSDPRFSYLSGHKRKVIFAWTQREYRNLLKARSAGVRVPLPYAVRENVIVEELIGFEEDNHVYPAPPLKDAPPKDPQKFYEDVVAQMQLMASAGLVHGDLSPFNILNLEEKPVIIDFSQSTIQDNAMYNELLERDCKNITKAFTKLGAETIPSKVLAVRLRKDLKTNC